MAAQLQSKASPALIKNHSASSIAQKKHLRDNTWHWPGKAAAMLLALLCLAIAMITPAYAGLPTYRNSSGYGYGTITNAICYPAQPIRNSQIRIVSILYGNDNAAGQFQFSSGTIAYSLVNTNPATSSITNAITSTNGLAGGSILILQHNGVCYTNSVVSWGNVFTNLNGLAQNQCPPGLLPGLAASVCCPASAITSISCHPSPPGMLVRRLMS